MKSGLLERIYLAGSGTVFLLVAVFHLFRIIFQWPIIVGALEIPFWFSYTGLPSGIAASILAFWLFRKR